MQKMRVLQIIKGLDLGGRSGGAERFGVDLSLALSKLDIEVSLAAFFSTESAAEKQWIDTLRKAGVAVHFASRAGLEDKPTHILPVLYNFQKHLPGAPFDIIHSHYQIGSLLSWMPQRKKKCGAFIRTVHVSQEWGTGAFAWFCRQAFSKFLFPLACQAQVGVSQAIVDQVKGYLGTRLSQRPPHKIYNAIQLEAFFPKRASETPKRGLVIGSVGRLISRKGYAYLIEAAAQLMAEQPDLRVCLAGDGEQKSELEALAKRVGLQNQIYFAGSVRDVPGFLNQIDLFVLPSLVEGLPTVVLEAMAAGVPVVATDIPGTRELIVSGKSGWLVKPGNAKSLVEGIRRALACRPEWEEICTHARQRLDDYSMEHVAQQYADLYQEVSGS